MLLINLAKKSQGFAQVKLLFHHNLFSMTYQQKMTLPLKLELKLKKKNPLTMQLKQSKPVNHFPYFYPMDLSLSKVNL